MYGDWHGLAPGSRRYLTIVELHYIALGYPEHSLVILVYHKELDSVLMNNYTQTTCTSSSILRIQLETSLLCYVELTK